MKKIFDEVRSLDKRAITNFLLSEDILMEHAANSISEYIRKKFKRNKTVLIVIGSGNNGADGLALARLLYKRFEVKVYLAKEPKSEIAKIQEQRIKALGLDFVNEIFQADIIVDCLFGTGLNKPLDEDSLALIRKLNSFNSFKIACDIPSGIDNFGRVENEAFKANITITMGALKTALFSDIAKDFVGKIKLASLGLDNEVFQTNTNKFLLEKKDLKLPKRKIKNTNKGDFGHLNLFAGNKLGACIIASKSAFIFGAGLVSIISKEEKLLPSFIMQDRNITKNCTAIAIGMGFGEIKDEDLRNILEIKVPKLLDADIFYKEQIIDYIDENVVLSPHPKEFVSLLKLTKIADISVNELQKDRFSYVDAFCLKYPKTTLLLKGANVIVAQGEKRFINTFGSSKLSKGGSGDVLSGLIASLLAQAYSPLDSAINASLAHSLAAKKYKKNNYSLSPDDLIEEIKTL